MFFTKIQLVLLNRQEMNHLGKYCCVLSSFSGEFGFVSYMFIELLFPDVGKCSEFKKTAKRLTILTRPANENIGR